MGAGFGGKGQEFNLGCGKGHMSVSYPKINTLFHLVWVGGVNWGTDII